MPRVGLSEEEASPEARRLFQDDIAAYGAVQNSTKVYAYHPTIPLALRNLATAIGRASQLPRELRWLIDAKAASLVGCPS